MYATLHLIRSRHSDSAAIRTLTSKRTAGFATKMATSFHLCAPPGRESPRGIMCRVKPKVHLVLRTIIVSRMVAICMVVASICLQARTQSAPPLDRVGISDTGIHPYGAYDGTNEHINLENNNLNISIPLLSLPGRNHDDLVLSLIYDSNIWRQQAEWDNQPPGPHWITRWAIEHKYPYIADGWNLSWPTIIGTGATVHYKEGESGDNYSACTGSTTVMLADGSRHIFNNNEGCFNLSSPYLPSSTEIPVMDSEDTDGMQINHEDYPDAGATSGLDYVVTLRNGTKLFFKGIPNQATEYTWVDANTPSLPAYKIVDANGNTISQQTGSDGTMTITDTVGRTVMVKPGSISYTDVNGNPQTIAYQVTQQQSSTPDSLSVLSETLLQSVTINQGASEAQTYGLSYNQNGELSKIIYPHGGCSGYVYSNYDRSLIDPPPGTPSGTLSAFIPGVATKYVSPSGQCDSSAATTIYQATAGGPTNTEMDITFPDGTVEKHVFSGGSISPWEMDHGVAAHETEVDTVSNSGAILKTVKTTWTGNTTWDLPQTIKTTFQSNQQTEKAVQYHTISALYEPSLYINEDSVSVPTQPVVQTIATRYLDVPVQESTYDYGSGSPGVLMRTVASTYLDYSASTVRILGLLASSITSDSIYSFVAANSYDYASNPYTTIQGSLVSSGATMQLQAMGSAPRGELTTAARCADNSKSTSPSSCSHWIATSYSYDDAGNMVSTTDAANHKTVFTWADNWSQIGSACVPQGNSAAYLTAITNAKNFNTTAQYRSCTGARDYVTDVNRQTTRYTFDSLGRIKSEVLPDGGNTTVTYNDAANQVTFAKAQVGSTVITKLDAYDGIGRLIQTQLTSDPQGADIIDRQYDGRDRLVQESNPHRSVPGSTDGAAGYQYDGLSRAFQITHYPDSSTVTTDYSSFPCVTVTDEAGRSTKKCVDALGRLSAVFEDPAGLNYETQYSYDAVGNLVNVAQGSLTNRTFSYDGLSRLLTAFNPEAGLLTYSYVNQLGTLCSGDPAALCSKTDARAVTTTFSYDVLNRLTSKSYSDGATPTACYLYDTVVNGNGRLGVEWTQTTSTCPAAAPSSGFLTMRSVLSYDPTGRILAEQQGTPASQASGVIYTPHYNYDLAGDLIASTDGITAVPNSYAGSQCANSQSPWATLTWTNCYDSAQHLTSVTSNWGDATHSQSLFFGATYSAPGGLVSANYGNGTTLSRSYDNRLRVSGEIDSGLVVTSSTPGVATVQIIGAEQSK